MSHPDQFEVKPYCSGHEPLEELLRRREAQRLQEYWSVQDSVQVPAPARVRAVLRSYVQVNGTSPRVLEARLASRWSQLGNTVEEVRNSVLQDLARDGRTSSTES